MKKEKFGYMCLVDFQYELGEADMNTIYSSIESLRKNRNCVSQCGIAKVKVQLEEIVQDSQI